eukprot:Gb_38647 [translate_table: standard]
MFLPDESPLGCTCSRSISPPFFTRRNTIQSQIGLSARLDSDTEPSPSHARHKASILYKIAATGGYVDQQFQRQLQGPVPQRSAVNSDAKVANSHLDRKQRLPFEEVNYNRPIPHHLDLNQEPLAQEEVGGLRARSHGAGNRKKKLRISRQTDHNNFFLRGITYFSKKSRATTQIGSTFQLPAKQGGWTFLL